LPLPLALAFFFEPTPGRSKWAIISTKSPALTNPPTADRESMLIVIALLPGGVRKENEKVITVLFQNIQVLAVGTNYDPMGTIPPYDMQKSLKALNVTFAVSPEEAGLLAFAQANGRLQLTLRSPAEIQDRVLQQVASWDALAEFVLERQGTDLHLPKKFVPKKKKLEEIKTLKPFIQIFRGGQEL